MRPRHQRRDQMIPLTKRPLPELLGLPDGASVNERETAEVLGVSPRTSQCWRREGRGPAFVRLGKAIRYQSAACGPSRTPAGSITPPETNEPAGGSPTGPFTSA